MAGPGGQEAGRVSIRVLPDLTHFRLALDRYLTRVERSTRLDINLNLDTTRARAQLEEFQRSRSMRVRVDVDRGALDRLTGTFGPHGSLAKGPIFGGGGGGRVVGGKLLTGRMRAILAGAVAISPLLGPLAAGITQAAGAMSLLPAVAGAAAVGIGTLAVGFNGMGAAIKAVNKNDPKKIEKALRRLSPAAREVVLAFKGLGPVLHTFQQAVQQNIFEKLGSPLRQIVHSYLPVFTKGMSKAAHEVNRAARQAVGFLLLPQSLKDTSTGLANTNKGFRILSGSVLPLLQMFRDLMVVGSSFLPQLAQGFTNVTKRAAKFIAEARRTGELTQFMKDSISAVKDLAVSMANVAIGIKNFFLAGSGSTGTFLKQLRAATKAFADFTARADVQRGLGAIFDGIAKAVGIVASSLADRLGPALDVVGPALASLAVNAAKVFVAFTGAIGPAIQKLAPVIAAAADKLGPALSQSFSNLAPIVASAAAALAQIIPPLTDLAVAIIPPLTKALGVMAPLLGPIVAGFIAFAGVAKIFRGIALAIAFVQRAIILFRAVWLGINILFAISPIGATVLALAALAAILVFTWKKSEVFRDIVKTVFEGLKVVFYGFAFVAIEVFRGILTVWLAVVGGLVSGAAAAFGWVPGLGGKLKEANRAFKGMKDGILGSMDDLAAGLKSKMEESTRNVAIQSALQGVAMHKGIEDRLPAYQQIAQRYGLTLPEVLKRAGVDAKTKSTIMAQAAIKGVRDASPAMQQASARLAHHIGQQLDIESSSAYAAAQRTGAGIAQGLAIGMASRAAAVNAQARYLGQLATQAIAGAAQTHSPSRLTIKTGKEVGAGLAVGMTQSQAKVSDAAKKLAHAATKALAAKMRERKALDTALRNLGASLGESFLRSMRGSESQIRNRVASLTDAIRKSPVNVRLEDRAVAALRAGQSKLVAAVRQRESIATRLKAAQQKLADAIQARADFAAHAREDAQQFASIVGLTGSGDQTSADLLIQGLKNRLAAIQKYQADLAKLAKKGISADIIQQIASAGIDSGSATAAALAQATKDQVTQINAVQAQIGKAATAVGNTVLGSMNTAGIKAAEGLIAGLKAKQKDIEAVILAIAKSMQKAIKTALGIHSPSRVFAEIGKQIPAGLVQGIESQTQHVNRALSRMGQTSGGAQPVTTVGVGAAGGGNVTINGNVGWQPDEVVDRIAVKKRDAIALAGL